MKVVILDDEKNCVEVLQYELNRLNFPIEIVETFTDPVRAFEQIQKIEFDVLFLDIEMPEMNAFEFLDKLGPIEAKVIFTTAYDHFALKAFRYYAVDYLLKPISKQDLEESLSRLESSSISIEKELLDEIYQRIKSPNSIFNKIAVPIENGFELVEIADIVYCEADGNYSRIHMKNERELMISKTLKFLDNLLSAHGFYRIHQSALVNINYISRYSRAEGGLVILNGGKEVRVSRANKKDFEQFLKAN